MHLMKISLMTLIAPILVNAHWQLGPFVRPEGVNPVISPLKESIFFCPAQQSEVPWEGDHTFNPAAIVRDGKVYLLYRAEDNFGQGIGNHTSRLGLAVSTDGMHFERRDTPVLYPDLDSQAGAEWPGGCEDPRIVEREDGLYVMTYTQYDHHIAQLAIATSKDLVHWEKYGYAFAESPLRKKWSKSGAIVCRFDNGRLVAAKIQGKYWMYWGERHLYAAVSDDLISWAPLLNDHEKPYVVASPRMGKFDSLLVEPGPPAILTEHGIVLLYNGQNSHLTGDPQIGPGAYSAGQFLLNPDNPTLLLDRLDEPFFRPELPYEKTGQYKEGTVFLEGLVYFQGRWLLYYGCADSLVGVAEMAIE